MPRQQRRDGERRQHGQQLRVVGVPQIEMQQAQHDQQPEQRQLQAARQGSIEGDQQDQLLHRLLLKIRRAPFRERRQRIAEAEDAQRHQQRLRPIRREAGHEHGRGAELRPTGEQRLALQGIARADHRFEGKGAGQQQAQGEAALQVGP